LHSNRFNLLPRSIVLSPHNPMERVQLLLIAKYTAGSLILNKPNLFKENKKSTKNVMAITLGFFFLIYIYYHGYIG
jgi:hypothetical protein